MKVCSELELSYGNHLKEILNLWHGGQSAAQRITNKKGAFSERDRTRTCNPQIRSLVPYPLGHTPAGYGWEQRRIGSCREINVRKKTWRCRGSNPGPHTCKACALPLSYIPWIVEDGGGSRLENLSGMFPLHQFDQPLGVKNKATHGGTRTHNLPLRRRTPYPLGHAGMLNTWLQNQNLTRTRNPPTCC